MSMKLQNKLIIFWHYKPKLVLFVYKTLQSLNHCFILRLSVDKPGISYFLELNDTFVQPIKQILFNEGRTSYLYECQNIIDIQDSEIQELYQA